MTIRIQMEGSISSHPQAQALRHAIYAKAKEYPGLTRWRVTIHPMTTAERQHVEGDNAWYFQPNANAKTLDVAIAADAIEDTMGDIRSAARAICKIIDHTENADEKEDVAHEAH